MFFVATDLISSITDRWQLLIDIAIIVGLGAIHVMAWPRSDHFKDSEDAYKEQARTGIHSAATGGITVAGILIPLSILTITLGSNKPSLLRSTVVTDFFVANVWLLVSLLLGLYVLFVSGVRGYKLNIFSRRDVGIIYGLQLLFLGVGVIRLVWGMAGLKDLCVKAGLLVKQFADIKLAWIPREMNLEADALAGRALGRGR